MFYCIGHPVIYTYIHPGGTLRIGSELWHNAYRLHILMWQYFRLTSESLNQFDLLKLYQVLILVLFKQQRLIENCCHKLCYNNINFASTERKFKLGWWCFVRTKQKNKTIKITTTLESKWIYGCEWLFWEIYWNRVTFDKTSK